MSVTTIKVDTDVRDRLAALAKKRDQTLGALLKDLLRKAEKEARWLEVRLAYEQLMADPEEWADYMSELTYWTEGSDGGFWADHQAAREEWPEYNQPGQWDGVERPFPRPEIPPRKAPGKPADPAPEDGR